MHHPTDRIAHTTAFVTPVVEHWLEGEIVSDQMPDLTDYQINVQARSLGTQFLTNARKCVPNEKKRRGKGDKS